MDWISYKKRGWQNPYLIGYVESHDEERLMYDVMQNGRSADSYNTRNLVTALNRAKLAAAFSLLVPGPKLLWQFGELGYDVNIDFNGRTGAKPLRWEYQNDAERQKLYKVYSELIKLKTNEAVFKTSDYSLSFDGMVKRMVLVEGNTTAFMIGNFDVRRRTEEAKFPAVGTWYDYFTGESVNITNPVEQIVLQPGEFRIFTTNRLSTPQAGLVPWQNVALSAEDELAARSTSVYPNPFEDKAQVEINSNYRGEVTLTLLDLTGRLIQKEVISKDRENIQHTLHYGKVGAGIYLLQVEIGQGKTIKKMVKLY